MPYDIKRFPQVNFTLPTRRSTMSDTFLFMIFSEYFYSNCLKTGFLIRVPSPETGWVKHYDCLQLEVGFYVTYLDQRLASHFFKWDKYFYCRDQEEVNMFKILYITWMDTIDLSDPNLTVSYLP